MQVILTNQSITAVEADALPKGAGFFWGESTPDDKADDLEFIREARKRIKAGKAVFYTSWW